MSDDINRLGGGPACELPHLIVEVIGKYHRVAQKVVLRRANGESLWHFPDTLERTWCSSTLHAWDDLQPDDRLCLEIATAEDEPILLPLLDTVQCTPRQFDGQWNQVVPVLPFVAMPGSAGIDDLGTPVLARPGYVYVFYQDRLWREVEICIDDGQTTYHDINLARYRTADGFKPGPRQATGLPLRDIWLPVRFNNQPVTDLQLCYSEIQLSAARLRLLEQDRDLRWQRCQRLQDSHCSNQYFRDAYSRRPNGLALLESFSSNRKLDPRHDTAQINARTQVINIRRDLELRCFPVSLMAAQRPREPAFEWQLEHPGRYLCDLSGEFPADAHDEAMSFLASCSNGTPHDPAKRPHLEFGALASVMQSLLPASEAPPQADDTENPWELQAAVQDVLANARERQICGVLLDDSRYRLRHLKTRLDTHHELLNLCAAQAMQQKHHASALLLHHLVVPKSLHGQPNPLQASLDALDDQGRQSIDRHLLVAERLRVWEVMAQTQERLTACLQLPRTQQTLADHLSLEGFEYASALLAIAQTLATLASTPSRLDPLAMGGDLNSAVTGFSTTHLTPSKGQQWLSHLASDSNLPLHRMLWPPSDPQRACAPYQPPEAPESNPGDGLWLAHELAKLENAIAPEPRTLTTLDAIVVANLLAGGSLDSFLIGSGKNIGNALMSIQDTLQGAVTTAQAAVDQARAHLAQTTQQAGTGQTTSQTLDATRRKLAAQAHAVNIRLHMQGIEQLRSLLPGTFGAVHFMPGGQAKAQNRYVFGLEDLPARMNTPTRPWGQYLDRDGNPLRTTYTPPRAAAHSADHLVLAIDRNHSTAQRISHMNRQLAAAQQADANTKAAGSQSAKGRSALSDALQQRGQASNGRLYRLLNSSPFPVGVLMIEMWNVSAEMKSQEQNIREKGSSRARAGMYSARIDLLIAMEALAVKLTGMQSSSTSLPVTRKVLLEISKESAARLLGSAAAEYLNRTITLRLMFQSVSSLLFAGLSFYDAWHAWRWNDEAMYGYLLMGIGGLLGAASMFIKAAPILGLSPLGWMALLATGVGLGLVLWLSKSPLEKWLAKGPFGSDNDEDVAHLQNPEEAFYRLLSLLAGFSISARPNPLYNTNWAIDPEFKAPKEVSRCTTIIRIESRLPGLMSPLGDMDIQAFCRLREVSVVVDPLGLSGASKRLQPYDTSPRAQCLLPNALELYVETPPDRQIDAQRFFGYEWAVRAQFRLVTPTQLRYFPGPAVTDPLAFGPADALPDFNQTNRPFWADEQTHRAKL